jgi:sulfonate transport system ATP-binding protein
LHYLGVVAQPCHPRLLLLDEPLGALDALTRIKMQHLIERLWLRSGLTVVLVTHDVDEGIALSDRVIRINQGRIGSDLPVKLSRPPHGSSAAFGELTERVLDRVMQKTEPQN